MFSQRTDPQEEAPTHSLLLDTKQSDTESCTWPQHGPPAPSSILKRARGGAEHDCTVMSIWGVRGGCWLSVLVLKSKGKNSEVGVGVKVMVTQWTKFKLGLCLGAEVTCSNLRPGLYYCLPMPIWHWQEVGTWWPWHSQHRTLAEQGFW